MSETVAPKGEALRKAIRWMADQRRENPETASFTLVQEASLRFDLSPMETDFLSRKFVLPADSEDAVGPDECSVAEDVQEDAPDCLAECVERIAPYLALRNRFFCYQGPDPRGEARILEEAGVEIRWKNNLGADFLAIPRRKEVLQLFSRVAVVPCDFCGLSSSETVHDYLVYDGQLFRACGDCGAHQRLEQGEVVATQGGRYNLRKQEGEYRVVY